MTNTEVVETGFVPCGILVRRLFLWSMHCCRYCSADQWAWAWKPLYYTLKHIVFTTLFFQYCQSYSRCRADNLLFRTDFVFHYQVRFLFNPASVASVPRTRLSARGRALPSSAPARPQPPTRQLPAVPCTRTARPGPPASPNPPTPAENTHQGHRPERRRAYRYGTWRGHPDPCQGRR